MDGNLCSSLLLALGHYLEEAYRPWAYCDSLEFICAAVLQQALFPSCPPSNLALISLSESYLLGSVSHKGKALMETYCLGLSISEYCPIVGIYNCSWWAWLSETTQESMWKDNSLQRESSTNTSTVCLSKSMKLCLWDTGSSVYDSTIHKSNVWKWLMISRHKYHSYTKGILFSHKKNEIPWFTTQRLELKVTVPTEFMPVKKNKWQLIHMKSENITKVRKVHGRIVVSRCRRD